MGRRRLKDACSSKANKKKTLRESVGVSVVMRRRGKPERFAEEGGANVLFVVRHAGRDGTGLEAQARQTGTGPSESHEAVGVSFVIKHGMVGRVSVVERECGILCSGAEWVLCGNVRRCQRGKRMH